MIVFALLAICGLVFLILARPFRQAPRPDTAAAPGPTPGAGQPSDSAALSATSPTPSPSSVSDSDSRTQLLDGKDRIFQALADLRFDYEAGKLSREDFELEDARLRARAAALLRELED